MGLRDVVLKRRYRTGRDNLVSDFYVPTLSESKLYQRAVGYFNSGALSIAAQGLNRLIEVGGRVQIVASPQFDGDDIAALQRGLTARHDIIEKALLRGLVASSGNHDQRRFEYLAWMVAEELLEIRIAVMRDPALGLFHEKFGLMNDGANIVAFSGSANETLSAHMRNFESFCVYRSWDATESTWVQEFEDDFATLWSNQTPGLEVISLPEEIIDVIQRSAPSAGYIPPPDPEEIEGGRSAATPLDAIGSGVPRIPTKLDLRPYQRSAIQNWFDSNGRGIFELATGTGKTIAALVLMTKLHEVLEHKNHGPLIVIVTVPYINLASQWERELTKFGILPIVAAGTVSSWRNALQVLLDEVRATKKGLVAIVTTNKTLSMASFQGLASQFGPTTLIIADEVHNLGAPTLAAALPNKARYRLGLSATPDRWMDDQGTERIKEYFGEIVGQKSLIEAIREGYLCQYDYHPIVVELDEDERERYLELSERIAKLAAFSEKELSAENEEGPLRKLLFERARLIGAARGKLQQIVSAANKHRNEGKIVVYCSDARELGADEKSGLTKQIDQVVSALCLPPVSIAAAAYTYRVPGGERARLERAFSAGDIGALVAIRCLDEGLDIPSMQTAIIAASTTNPRQFIQRRGRVLRKHPGKQYATIYDLIVSPGDPKELSDAIFNLERRLFRRELQRVVEFASAARNRVEAMHDLLRYRQVWNCLDI